MATKLNETTAWRSKYTEGPLQIQQCRLTCATPHSSNHPWSSVLFGGRHMPRLMVDIRQARFINHKCTSPIQGLTRVIRMLCGCPDRRGLHNGTLRLQSIANTRPCCQRQNNTLAPLPLSIPEIQRVANLHDERGCLLVPEPIDTAKNFETGLVYSTAYSSRDIRHTVRRKTVQNSGDVHQLHPTCSPRGRGRAAKAPTS